MKVGDDLTFVSESSVRESILEHLERLSYHLEEISNWVIGFASVVAVLIITNFGAFSFNFYSKFGAAIILYGCVLTLIIVVPNIVPNLFKKRDIRLATEKSIFSYSNIAQNYSVKSLEVYLGKLRSSSKLMDEEFAKHIHSYATYRIPKRAKVLRLGGWILFTSFVIGFVLISVGFVYF